MNRKQEIAITNPCVEAEDCAHSRYKSYALPWSVILTVNSGFE